MLLVALANIGFAIVSLTVGIRMLRLAQRSRRAPELYLGLGLLGLALGLPILGASGVGRQPVGGVNLPLLAAGFATLSLGLTSLFAFTWQAFRPSAGWAAALVALASAVLLVISAGAVHAIATADPEMASNVAGGAWLVAVRGPMTLGFLWAAVESSLQYRMARRRQALGLGDPVVANRFLIWSSTSLLTATTNVVSAVLQAQGLGPLNSPLGASLLAVGGGTSALLICLVFMPPARYVELVRRRAAAA